MVTLFDYLKQIKYESFLVYSKTKRIIFTTLDNPKYRYIMKNAKKVGNWFLDVL